MNIDNLILGLLWKLELNHPCVNPQVAWQHWQVFERWLQKNNHLEQLIAVIAGTLAEVELRTLLSPQGQPSRNYKAAFSNWIGLIDFVEQNKKADVTTVINRQASAFVVKQGLQLANCSPADWQPEVIASQIQQKLYSWHGLDNQVDSSVLEPWLKAHPDNLSKLISEICKPLVENELKFIVRDRGERSKNDRQAQQYWVDLINYIKNQYNPEILAKIISRVTAWLTAVAKNNGLPFHQSNLNTVTQSNPSQASLWCWRAIQAGEDNHSECACRSEVLPNGLKMMAARVRGKKHKHDGTNCDDWFEIAQSGEWGIIAVSDGAGSKMFSRVGARVACEAAVNYLVEKLQSHQIKTREAWSTKTFARDEAYQFQEPDLELTQQFLHEAMQAAYHAVVEAYHARDSLKYYYKALGHRDLTLSDFAATLLLAVHTTIQYKATAYSFVLACQVGDGMSAAIYKNQASTCVLGEIERNGFGGETEFITSSKRKLERDYLSAKTYPFFSPLRALMVMTDGVSDDYFPPRNGMLQLFGELVLNGIIPITTSRSLSQEERAALEQRRNEYLMTHERITKQGPCPTLMGSVTHYAQILNLSLEELIASPIMLAAGVPEEILENNPSTPEERLQWWLDTYHVRGSFDDRTLVVLFNEP